MEANIEFGLSEREYRYAYDVDGEAMSIMHECDMVTGYQKIAGEIKYLSGSRLFAGTGTTAGDYPAGSGLCPEKLQPTVCLWAIIGRRDLFMPILAERGKYRIVGISII